MKPNCNGCMNEMSHAYMMQELGYNVALENMGIKKHCLCFVIEDVNEIEVIEMGGSK